MTRKHPFDEEGEYMPDTCHLCGRHRNDPIHRDELTSKSVAKRVAAERGKGVTK